MNQKWHIILASASPRRRELLSQLGFVFDIEPALGDEEVSASYPPEKVVQELAYAKAKEIRSRHQADGTFHKNTIIIGADTIVVKNGAILGKPSDKQDAFHMLYSLSDATHQVYTGVAILSTEWEVRFGEKTDVTFYPVTDDEINSYIETGEPMDKAGAYGIQGIGAKFVEKINGDYNNVVGLPIARLYQVLKEI